MRELRNIDIVLIQGAVSCRKETTSMKYKFNLKFSKK